MHIGIFFGIELINNKLNISGDTLFNSNVTITSSLNVSGNSIFNNGVNMSNILTNSLETKSYTVFLSSVDKASGNNNSATFQINWADFLPRKFTTYKMSFSFQSGGGNYKDSSFTNNTK